MHNTTLKRILIVDDDPADRILLMKILGNKYDFIEANNGQEAIDLAHGELPDLILMDIMMPEVDGYTACNIIKNDTLTAEIPIIMLTGLESELNIRLANEIGATGYITKPVQPQELRVRIEQVFNIDM